MERSQISVDTEGCRQRRTALLSAMKERGLDRVLLTRPESVQWLTGLHLGPLFAVGAAVDTSGQVTLVLPQRKLEADAVADDRIGYQAKRHSTMRNDMHREVGRKLAERCDAPVERTGVEHTFAGPLFAAFRSADCPDVEDLLVGLRRRKHDDELRTLAHANRANQAMYTAARAFLQPGTNELDLYSHLQATAVEVLGEPLTYFGQDFRCAARGGPPRDRPAQHGELYVLDLGVGFRGYYSDNARTLAVGGEPTPVQREAHAAILEVFSLVERTVRPGVSCRDLHNQAAELLAPAPGEFNHHLGHGVGLAPHEGPHLNPEWDEVFEVGDFFTAEPGLYSDELRAGLRLEQNYVVTEDGVRLLTDWPLDF